MTEKDLLKIRSLRKEEWYLSDRIGELESQMYSLQSPSLEPSYGGNGEDALTALIESRDKLKADLIVKQMEIVEVETELEQAMSVLSSEERMVIRLYYIKAFIDWDTVAGAMQYSTRRVLQFRETAIEKLSKIALNCSKFHL